MLWVIPVSRTTRQVIQLIEITQSDGHQQKIMKQQCTRNGQMERQTLFILRSVFLIAIRIPSISQTKMMIRKMVGLRSRTRKGKIKLVKQRYQFHSIQLFIMSNRFLDLIFGLFAKINLEFLTHSNLNADVLFDVTSGWIWLFLERCMRTRRQQKGKSVKNTKERMQAVELSLFCASVSPNDSRIKDQGKIKGCMSPII